MKRLNKLLIIIAIFFVLFAVSVAAQTGPNLVEALRPLQNLNFIEAYETYWFIFDFVFALILFLGVTRGVLLQRYPGGPGAMIAGALSLFLALGFVIGEKRFNFRIFHLSPYILLFVLALGIFVAFRFLRQWGPGGRLGIGLLLLFVISIFYANPEMNELREYAFNIPIAGIWLALVVIAAIIVGIYMTIMGFVDLVRWLRGGVMPDGIAPGAPPAAPGGGNFRRLWNRMPWSATRRAQRDLEEEARYVRVITETINRMDARYRTMVGITMNQGIPINRAFQFLMGHGAAGLTPAQQAYLNANRITLEELHREWTADWDTLIRELGRIATLSQDLRNMVVTQLTRPI